jgi:bacteriochlorophyllide a dehydrogenase
MGHSATAVVFQSPNLVRLEQLEMPAPRVGELQIRTRYSGISAGTEGHVLAERFTSIPAHFPCVPGYQRIGVIEAIGEGVQGFVLGQRVFATGGSWSDPVQPRWGAHLSLANTAANEVYCCPEGISDIDLAHTVVAQVGYNAASRVSNLKGNWVVVYGDGLIGQTAAQCARARGAKVILVGHRNERLELAQQCSADAVVNSHNQDVRAVVMQQTSGKPVVAILDSVQGVSVQQEYIGLLEHGVGQIVYCGYTPGTVWADMALLQEQELIARFVSGWTRERLEATMSLMQAGQLRLEPLMTHIVPFDQAAQMYQINAQKSLPHLGMTLDWTRAN